VSTQSGQTGRGFSRLDWILLVLALFALGPILWKSLEEWFILMGEM
jgi:hypothetical protein